MFPHRLWSSPETRWLWWMCSPRAINPPDSGGGEREEPGRWQRLDGASQEAVPNVHPVSQAGEAVGSYPKSAVGQVGFSTPAGRWSIVTKQRNPWWHPPPSPWAANSDPVPPGPGNPLGTRWMGLNASFIGIHGTPSSGSLGSRASHGCIRMNIGDAEWMFDRVDIGTPVLVI